MTVATCETPLPLETYSVVRVDGQEYDYVPAMDVEASFGIPGNHDLKGKTATFA